MRQCGQSLWQQAEEKAKGRAAKQAVIGFRLLVIGHW
jgi:hypothetical protein